MFAEDKSGSWGDGMTSESSTMLYRALHNIIERCVWGCVCGGGGCGVGVCA